MQQASLGYIKIHLTSDIPGLMIDQYHPEAAWSLQLFPHVFSPPGASFWIQVAAFRHFIQQFDLLHRKILAVPFFPFFSEVVVHLIFYRTTCHHLLNDQHLWSSFSTCDNSFSQFHPSRPSALCSVSSSQIASSPGEKFHQNLCFFLSWSSSNHLKSGKGAEDLLLFSESA